jgi:hypothetical protein
VRETSRVDSQAVQCARQEVAREWQVCGGNFSVGAKNAFTRCHASFLHSPLAGHLSLVSSMPPGYVRNKLKIRRVLGMSSTDCHTPPYQLPRTAHTQVEDWQMHHCLSLFKRLICIIHDPPVKKQLCLPSPIVHSTNLSQSLHCLGSPPLFSCPCS